MMNQTSQHNCIRCAATGALLAIAIGSVLVIASTGAKADQGQAVWSSKTGAGWLMPVNPHYPDHGYTLQRGDGTAEHIDIEPLRQDYLPRNPRFEAPHRKYMRKWGLKD